MRDIDLKNYYQFPENNTPESSENNQFSADSSEENSNQTDLSFFEQVAHHFKNSYPPASSFPHGRFATSWEAASTENDGFNSEEDLSGASKYFYIAGKLPFSLLGCADPSPHEPVLSYDATNPDTSETQEDIQEDVDVWTSETSDIDDDIHSQTDITIFNDTPEPQETQGLDADGNGSTEDAFPDQETTDTSPLENDDDGDNFIDKFFGGNDCNDDDPKINPKAQEICDYKDNNCNDKIDEDPIDGKKYYSDADNDGYTTNSSITSCEQPKNYSAEKSNPTDCNDAVFLVNPGRPEVLDNNLDDNCDGIKEYSPPVIDNDGDGFAVENDCNDANEKIHPDADEKCDGIDNNCDEIIDTNAVDLITSYEDLDHDKYVNVNKSYTGCDVPENFLPYITAPDCDDMNLLVNPGAPETCNGADDDCNSIIDEDPTVNVTRYYLDEDGDGFANNEKSVWWCNPLKKYTLTEQTIQDCDDSKNSIYPGAAEICDGLDNNCDLTIDTDATDKKVFYADLDSDGFTNNGNTLLACTPPENYSEIASLQDCNDSNEFIHPNASEICDEIDNNCDLEIDTDATNKKTFYADLDSDGFTNNGNTLLACTAPEKYSASPTENDCDDAQISIHPNADEICDEIDNNCDDVIDTDAVNKTVFYADLDSDGFTNINATQLACTLPENHSASPTENDCDDTQISIHPNADEICDEIDNNCDDVIDTDAVNKTIFYADLDGDQFTNNTQSITACFAPENFLEIQTEQDCNDQNSLSYPLAAERFDGKGEDNNCNQLNSLSLDNDSFRINIETPIDFNLGTPLKPVNLKMDMGDVDGNGFNDILVGIEKIHTEKEGPGGKQTTTLTQGAAYLILCDENKCANKQTLLLQQDADVKFVTTTPETFLGSNIGIEDVNDDGIEDFYIDLAGVNKRVLFKGGTALPSILLLNDTLFNNSNQLLNLGITLYKTIDTPISEIFGDIDGDGKKEFLAGIDGSSCYTTPAEIQPGQTIEAAPQKTHRFYGEGNFCKNVTAADVNDDGFTDLFFSDTQNNSKGETALILGGAAWPSKELEINFKNLAAYPTLENRYTQIFGDAAGTRAGTAIAVGTINGTKQIFIGAPHFTLGTKTNAGAVFSLPANEVLNSVNEGSSIPLNNQILNAGGRIIYGDKRNALIGDQLDASNGLIVGASTYYPNDSTNIPAGRLFSFGNLNSVIGTTDVSQPYELAVGSLPQNHLGAIIAGNESYLCAYDSFNERIHCFLR